MKKGNNEEQLPCKINRCWSLLLLSCQPTVGCQSCWQFTNRLPTDDWFGENIHCIPPPVRDFTRTPLAPCRCQFCFIQINLCATVLQNKFQQAWHHVTWFRETFSNFHCETSFTKSRTTFYFCNGCSGEKNEFHCVTPLCETGLARSCHATLRKPFRNRNKLAMIHFETSFNVPKQVSTFYVKRCNACWNLFSQRSCTQVSAKSFNV